MLDGYEVYRIHGNAIGRIDELVKVRLECGWKHGVHAFRGEKLPITRDGADTFPWERDSNNALKKNSPRNSVLKLLQFAHKHRLLDALNRDDPGSMEGKMNSFLREQHFADILKAETKVTLSQNLFH